MPIKIYDGLSKRCDCKPRNWPTCLHGWWFSFGFNGTSYRYSLDAVAGHREEQPPRSKVEANRWRDLLRAEIADGTFVPPPTKGRGRTKKAEPPKPPTLGDVADAYLRAHVNRPGRRDGGRKLMACYLAAYRRALVPAAHGATVAMETKQPDEVTKADVEFVRSNWPLRTTAAKGGRVGADRVLKRARHFHGWMIENGHATKTPFQLHGKVVIHFAKDGNRTRRLEGDEEARLLQHAASPTLRALIVAALETGMRKGELLKLQWQHVKADTNALLLPASITKTDEARDVPMTSRLKATLDLLKHAPDGAELPPEAFVFHSGVGEALTDIRSLWVATCTAAGITGLHFHDLRREFGSRLLETPGVSQHVVRDMLGHADLATTSKYLATTRAGLQQAMRAFELHQRNTQGTTQSPAETSTPGPEPTSATPANLLN
jgi:integrase